MVIRIKNLRLRTIIGTHDQERESAQDVIVNVAMEFDGAAAAASDDIQDAVNYQALTERIVQEVEASSFYLLEKLAAGILEIVLADPKVQKATVEVDKPGALDLADSVSVSCSAERAD